jgi:hypothetical protein
MKVLVLGVGTVIAGRVVNFVGISLTLLDGVLVGVGFFMDALCTGAFLFALGLVVFLLHVVVGMSLFCGFMPLRIQHSLVCLIN